MWKDDQSIVGSTLYNILHIQRRRRSHLQAHPGPRDTRVREVKGLARGFQGAGQGPVQGGVPPRPQRGVPLVCRPRAGAAGRVPPREDVLAARPQVLHAARPGAVQAALQQLCDRREGRHWQGAGLGPGVEAGLDPDRDSVPLVRAD